jgi:uncharacterized delta-60 repeat protein
MKKIYNSVLLLVTAITIDAQSLDSTFNGSGHSSNQISTGPHRAIGVHQQNNGSLILTANAGSGSNNYDYYSARYTSTGTLDNTYGVSGIVKINFDSTYDELLGSVKQPDDKIILIGATKIGAAIGFGIARLDANGTLDNTFNSNGKYFNTVLGEAYANCGAVLPNGQVLIAGGTKILPFNAPRMEALLRLNANGTLDNTFGTNGLTLNDLDTANGEEIQVLAIDSNQNIVVGSNGLPTGKAYISRFLSNGTLDASWGVNGNLLLSFITGNYPGVYDIQVQPDGKYLVSVKDQSFPTQSTIVARLNTNGTLDNTFNGVGYKSFFSIDPPRFTLQTDGKIIGVTTYKTFTPVFLNKRQLFRLHPNGNIDSTFGTNGFYDDLPKVLEGSLDIILQSDGKIVLTGDAFNNPNYKAGLSRYNNNLPSSISTITNKNNHYTIYPNPSSNSLNIETKNLSQEKIISISNVLGKVVYQSIIKKQNTQIDLQALKSGIYFLKIENGEAMKFIKE